MSIALDASTEMHEGRGVNSKIGQMSCVTHLESEMLPPLHWQNFNTALLVLLLAQCVLCTHTREHSCVSALNYQLMSQILHQHLTEA